MFQESKMCLQTIHQVMKGEINGSVALIVILSIQVVFSFALKRCGICVWHTSQYFQYMLW